MTEPTSTRPQDRTLVISYAEPVTDADWEREAGLVPAAPPRQQPTERFTVRLDVALAELPAGQRLAELTDVRPDMREHIEFCMAVAGWPALQETHRLLYASGATRVFNAWWEEVKSFVDDTVDRLDEVQTRAQAIMRERLDTARLQLVASALTFLDHRSQANFDRVLEGMDLAQLDRLRSGLVLKPGDHVTTLRQLLKELGPLNRAIRDADEWVRRQAFHERPTGSSRYRERYVAPARAAQTEALTARALRVHRDSGRWPLMAWLTDLDPQVSDEDLLDRVVEEITVVARAQLICGRQARDRAEWIGLEEATEDQVQRRWSSPALDIKDLGPSPFTHNMRSPVGPWQYPTVIATALDELEHGSPSAVAVAASEAMGGAQDTGLVWTVNAGIMALSIAFPPLGTVVGAAMAVWNLMDDLDDQERRKAGYRAVLDPSRSLAVKPSIARVLAGIVGVAGSLLPGWKGFALGMGEAAVRLTAD
ncbi:hypothetical protein [Streptomyces ossamyceticus]|uniref:hypothetical protein n=1 Tax=Streptomyces ossamyceticus TaxID=249581 RepID=UPI00343D2243